MPFGQTAVLVCSWFAATWTYDVNTCWWGMGGGSPGSAVWRLGPAVPAGPRTPVRPVGPTGPAAPRGPRGPAGPAGPRAPTGPLDHAALRSPRTSVPSWTAPVVTAPGAI